MKTILLRALRALRVKRSSGIEPDRALTLGWSLAPLLTPLLTSHKSRT